MTSEALATLNAIRTFDDAQLTGITSFADALALVNIEGIPLETAADYGTGFKVVEKASLLGVPFIILQWSFYPGKFGEDFVAIEAVTKHGEKVVLNDGSTGICKQLRTISDQRAAKKHPTPQAILGVEGGLTRTDYFYNEDTKETSNKPQTGKGWGPAQTYYLAS